MHAIPPSIKPDGEKGEVVEGEGARPKYLCSQRPPRTLYNREKEKVCPGTSWFYPSSSTMHAPPMCVCVCVCAIRRELHLITVPAEIISLNTNERNARGVLSSQ